MGNRVPIKHDPIFEILRRLVKPKPMDTNISERDFFKNIDATIEGYGYVPRNPCQYCGARFSVQKDEVGDIINWPEPRCCNMCIGKL